MLELCLTNIFLIFLKNIQEFFKQNMYLLPTFLPCVALLRDGRIIETKGTIINIGYLK